MENLDSDLLRTFLAVANAGSVTEGAAQINRSQSAASIQIKRLEQILGQPVFRRHGRGVVLSETGQKLFSVANEITERLDATLRDISERSITGKLRIGIPDDHGKNKLAQIIGSFTRQHPKIELEVTCSLSAGFPEALETGKLDLAVYEVECPKPSEELLFEDPTCWAAAKFRDFTRFEVLPVALFDHACWWREAAIKSLDACGRPYKIAYSSQSVSGIIAAIEAGVAIGLVGRSSLVPGLTIVSAGVGLGLAPSSHLVMAASRSQACGPVDAMKAAIRSVFLTGDDVEGISALSS